MASPEPGTRRRWHLPGEQASHNGYNYRAISVPLMNGGGLAAGMRSADSEAKSAGSISVRVLASGTGGHRQNHAGLDFHVARAIRDAKQQHHAV